MSDDYQTDNIDREILSQLQVNARQPFLEIARKIGCAGGTIHARVTKLKESGIIKGQKIIIDKGKLGYKLEAFLGVSVDNASKFADVSTALKKIPETLEIYYTTGAYSLLVKVAVRNTKDLFKLLSEKIQVIDHVRATDTLIVLDTLVSRDINLT